MKPGTGKDYDYMVKIIIVGDSNVGKTNILSRFVDNNFMQANDPRMPLFSERKTGVSFGRGSK